MTIVIHNALSEASFQRYVFLPRNFTWLTRSMIIALDNASHSIRVNCLCPSWVDTPMVSAAVAGNPALQSLMDKAVPMGRIAQVDEIADVVMFLCSDKASYVTESSWIVDRGFTLTSASWHACL